MTAVAFVFATVVVRCINNVERSGANMFERLYVLFNSESTLSSWSSLDETMQPTRGNFRSWCWKVVIGWCEATGPPARNLEVAKCEGLIGQPLRLSVHIPWLLLELPPVLGSVTRGGVALVKTLTFNRPCVNYSLNCSLNWFKYSIEKGSFQNIASEVSFVYFKIEKMLVFV